jgi:hypothetical protein
MATFEAQVEGLTSLSIDGSSAPTQTELTQFLTDGAKEIINILPPNLLDWCAAQQTFTSVMPGSEAETMNTGKILRVYRNDGDFDRVCRRIRADEKGYANDPDEMGYASFTDPVFYTENNKLNVLPQGGSCKYDEVQYPAVAYGDSAISVFPDEAEYLVSLYGAVKSLQNVLGDKSSNSDITTALTAMNTEIDECLAIADLINTQVDAAVVQIGEAATLVDANIDTAVAAITTALGRVNTAVALGNAEFDLVNPEVDLANAQVDAEDIELANGYISTAQGYANAGAQYISEAQASLSEAQGYASEVSARTGQVGSQVGVAQGYISAAQGFASELQGKINIAQGYANEVQSRLAVDTAHYGWYEKQQAKLQADYEGGVQKLLSGYKD